VQLSDSNKDLEDLLVFMHIPKTGGTTLREIIQRQYEPNKVWTFGTIYQFREELSEMSEKRIKQIRCLQGHACFGEVHQPFNRAYNYLTMLRDPIERMLSLYCRHGGAQGLSLKEFITKTDFEFATKNTQTRYASAEAPPNLEIAKENLEKHFAVVGITEMFVESIFLMKKELGWVDIDYTKKNISQDRLSLDEISQEVIEFIRENNELDNELYNYAKSRLESKIQNLSLESKEELDEFRTRCNNSMK